LNKKENQDDDKFWSINGDVGGDTLSTVTMGYLNWKQLYGSGSGSNELKEEKDGSKDTLNIYSNIESQV